LGAKSNMAAVCADVAAGSTAELTHRLRCTT
jgi:hypothetical protein